MKFCIHCGNQLENNAHYCNQCGMKQPDSDAFKYTNAETVTAAAAPAGGTEKKKFDWQIPKEQSGHQMTLQKYNAMLAGLLMYGFMVCAMICSLFAEELRWSNPIALVALYLIGAFIGGYLANRSKSWAVRFIGYNLLVVPAGAVVASCLPYYHYETVLYAVLGTALIAGVMLIAAMVRPQSFEGLGPVLVLSLISVIVVEAVLLIFFGHSSTFIDFAVIIVMAAFIGYDFVQANRAARTANNAIAFAIDLFLDIINIFIRLLSIFGSRD